MEYHPKILRLSGMMRNKKTLLALSFWTALVMLRSGITLKIKSTLIPGLLVALVAVRFSIISCRISMLALNFWIASMITRMGVEQNSKLKWALS